MVKTINEENLLNNPFKRNKKKRNNSNDKIKNYLDVVRHLLEVSILIDYGFTPKRDEMPEGMYEDIVDDLNLVQKRINNALKNMK